MKEELKPEALRYFCDPERLKEFIDKTLPSEETVIGQERAKKALHFGLGIEADGFNIYVSGQPGTGKLSIVQKFLKEVAKEKETPDDWCYVKNFADPYQPKQFSLPAGKAIKFKKDLKKFVEEVKKELIKAFESEEFMKRQKDIADSTATKQDDLFGNLTVKYEKEGFILKQSPQGIVIIPMKEGQPMKDDEFDKLPEEERKEIREKQFKIQEEIKRILRDVRKLERSANEELAKMNENMAGIVLDSSIEELEEKYENQSEIKDFLQNIKNDIIENLNDFIAPEESQGQNLQLLLQTENYFSTDPYNVNVLVDNSNTKGVPVIIEPHPTYNNLFGRIEKESQMGNLITDYSLIKNGSLHRANGGYLVIPVEELFRNIFSWESLKRALKRKEIVIEEVGEQLGFITMKTLKPEPIPLKVKVILLGDPLIYMLLYEVDKDFMELFKVKAEFDDVMERNESNLRDYVAFINTAADKEKLNPLNHDAIAEIIEHSARIAAHQRKLSVRFAKITDLVREASYYSKVDGRDEISAEHVKKAIDEKYYRSNLLQEKINEQIEKGQIKIDIEGEKIGQLNGLSYLSLGDISFGKPSRITCSISLGKDGIVDIEREVKLGGPIHSKGVMILSGYLAEKFASDKPISLNARLVFEQSYSEIEGDSASSTELYAILSSLAGLPLKQGIAVTGSVNQKGEVQAIGGINEKIEGFFEVCSNRGLTGNQGVLIPEDNLDNLVLKPQVVEAVSEGKFHIWAVKTIDEGIEILTGVKAGKLNADGTYEKDTVYYFVNQRLEDFTHKLRKFLKELKKRDFDESED